MKKFITSFLVFSLLFNIIFENMLTLSYAENIQKSILENNTSTDIDTDISQDNTENMIPSMSDNLPNDTETDISQEATDGTTPSLPNDDSSLQNNNNNLQNSQEDEIQPDPKENPKHIMGGSSSPYNMPLSKAIEQSKAKLNSSAIGSGTVNTDTLNVRSGPSTSYNKVGSLNNGDYVEIYGRSNNWYKIIYNNKFAYISSNYINLNILERGIDVSKWNGSIDWNNVKSSGIDYVMIRAGYGSSTVDPNFKSYIEGASAAGLKIGVYWFSYATSVDKARIEAEKCLQTISPYKDKISYPVYFDYEYASVDYATDNGITITKDLASQMANTFINTIKSSGYDTGLYTNKDFSSKYFDTELLYSNNLWIAQYNSQCTFDKPYMMWQYTDKGSVNGINGYVDMNYTYLKSMKYDYTGNVPPSNDGNLDTTTPNSINYKTHIEDYGWQNWTSNGQTSGTTGQNKQVESIEIKLSNAPSGAKVLYQTHVEDYGWLDWKYDGQPSGTTGQNKQVEAIKIKLENMNGYSVEYRVHVEDYGWLDWQYDGEIAGTVGENKKVEAIEIRIIKSSDKIGVDYRTHVEDYGWMNWTSNGKIAGTTGQSKQVESVQLLLTNAPSNANIVYEAHVEDYGWIGWSSNGNPSGTTGQNKQLEAIRIKLENMNGYNIKYRVHVEDYGWLDWKSNGEVAGTVGENKSVEAIEVKLVKK